MALLPVQQASLKGTVVTYTAAAGGGDTFPLNHEHQELRVKNGGGSAITVTTVVPGVNAYGELAPDIASSSIAAGAEVAIGPIPRVALDGTDNLIHVTYSGVTSVTVAVVGV